MKYFIAAFTGMCSISAIIAWCSGYSFDYRSTGVALWVFFTFIAALVFGAAVYDLYEKDK